MKKTPYEVRVQNPDAEEELVVGVSGNVSLDLINEQVAVNSKRDLEWIYLRDADDTPCVIVAGGPSLADELETIRALGSVSSILAVNGAAKYLADHSIYCDIQFIMDAREQNIDLVCKDAGDHIFASQCHPSLFEAVPDARLVHLASPGIEDHMPEDRKQTGGYSMIGGAATVGISALTLAHTLGFRDLHLFGYDSSVRGEQRHAYDQPMNLSDALIQKRLGDRAYWCPLAGAIQFDHFPVFQNALESLGCTLTVYGSGILPDRWKLGERLSKSEKEKYEHMWKEPSYRVHSPAMREIEELLEFVPEGAEVVDLGCGLARAGVALAEAGRDVTLVDIASNCREPEALSLKFIEQDLREPLLGAWPYGVCCDVMEHIPDEDVNTVLRNIRESVDNVFFRIEWRPEGHGPALIGKPLHLALHDEAWWKRKLHEYWPNVENRGNGVFLVSTDGW